MTADISLLQRVAASLRGGSQVAGTAHGATAGSSILASAAQLYVARPNEHETPPTGFDPAAAALFEAIVEGAFLVASADGEVDADERAAFETIVREVASLPVDDQHVHDLFDDLASQLSEDGLDLRLQAVISRVRREDHQREVLRVAAAIAQISSGVSADERGVLERLASGFGLEAQIIDAAVEEATRVLSS